MVDSAPSDALDSTEESELRYESVEPWAIVALVLGLLAPVALASSVLWFVPILGLPAASAALWRIRQSPGRSGRVLALVGLALSAFFLTAAIAETASAQWLLVRQARPVGDQFLEYLREGSPEKALMLRRLPAYRYPPDESLWSYYRRDDEAKAELRAFVRGEPIRMILALGDRADVRFYRTTGVGADGDVAQADLWYSITFTGADGRKKTYFLSLLLERKPTDDPDLNPWRVRDYIGGVDPRGR